MSSGTYAGESDAKKVARGIAYLLVPGTLGPVPAGYCLTLAGPNAPETTIWRDYLALPARRAVFVDRDQSAVQDAGRRWPGVTGFCDEIEDVLDVFDCGSLSLVHFDFMGPASLDMAAFLHSAWGKIATPGIVMVTYLRGREPRSSAVRRVSRNMTVGRAAFVETALGMMDGATKLAHIHYHSGRSPMGIVCFAKGHTPRNLRLHGPLEVHEVRPGGDSVREFACETMQHVDSKHVAALLDVEPSTVAAWRAHETRGTYKRKPYAGNYRQAAFAAQVDLTAEEFPALWAANCLVSAGWRRARFQDSARACNLWLANGGAQEFAPGKRLAFYEVRG